MKKNTAIIFRIAGIIFFIVNMLSVLEMFNVNISTFMYIITEDSRGWSIFFYRYGTALYNVFSVCTVFNRNGGTVRRKKRLYTVGMELFGVFACSTVCIHVNGNHNRHRTRRTVFSCAVNHNAAVLFYNNACMLKRRKNFFLEKYPAGR